MPNDKPKPKPEPSVPKSDEASPVPRPVQATAANFGMLHAAVMHIQQTLGEQLGGDVKKTELEHLERMETIKILSKTNALVKIGSYLLTTMAGALIYLLLEIHKLEVLIAGLRR